MPKVGKKTFGYSAKEKLKAAKYAKKTGKKMSIAGAKGGGSMARGMAARAKKRTTDARAQAQAKRSSRAASARAKARMTAARRKRG